MKSVLMRTLILFILTPFIFSCASVAGLTGTWRGIDSESILEFSRDGTFRAADDMGMSVTGTYSLSDNDVIRFVIPHGDGSEEIVIMEFSIKGDILTVTTPDRSETEQYRREP